MRSLGGFRGIAPRKNIALGVRGESLPQRQHCLEGSGDSFPGSHTATLECAGFRGIVPRPGAAPITWRGRLVAGAWLPVGEAADGIPYR